MALVLRKRWSRDQKPNRFGTTDEKAARYKDHQEINQPGTDGAINEPISNF